MKKTVRIILLTLLILLLASCSDEVKAPDDSWENIFLQYWNQMNTEYVHFSDDESLDWDEVYEDYIGKFRELDYTDKDDSIKAFRYFKEIAYNMFDYHYILTVKDSFGQSLSVDSAILRKYADAGYDIMDFPDVKLLASDGGTYLTAINNTKIAYDSNDVVEEWEKAVPSVYEVKSLMGSDATGKGNSWGNFHTSSGNDIDAEFPDNAYYGYTFYSFSDEAIEGLTTSEDKKAAEEWNMLVGNIGLDSYFYGLNEDGAFYIYFSNFGNTIFLTNLLTEAEDKLTADDKEIIENNSTVARLRGLTQDLMEKVNEDTISIDLKEKIEEGLEGIKGLNEMYKALLSATAENKAFEKEVKGVVVDLRSNGGGRVDFLEAIWGAFFPSETQFGYMRYKAGYARNEYTPWVSISIDGEFANTGLTEVYQKPVAVIVNGFSVSCSEMSCIIARLLPSSRIVGQQTFGATCVLSDRTIYNSGPFESEHISVYTTTEQCVDINRKSFETIGITPDIKTELSENIDYGFIEAVKYVTSK